LTLAASPTLARIPAGDFLMGASDVGEDERPVHRVHVGEFLIGRFPVTQDEYARFVRATGYPQPDLREPPLVAAGSDELFRDLAGRYAWRDGAPPDGHGSHPVVLVRYEDAAAYCGWLADATGQFVRLPTEAEWEKAARGGVEGCRYPWGNDIDPSRGNFLADAAAKRQRGTRPTGTYPPNGYGLYDMAGNVWEYTADPWVEGGGPARDSTVRRVIRGGSFGGAAVNLRVRYRDSHPAVGAGPHVGFRCARSG
jgi:formylglycine-generating enzyme required for sulfatase activity